MNARYLVNAIPGMSWFVNRKLTFHILKKAMKEAAQPAYVAKPRLLYVAASSLPYHISGYTTRTHEILRALQAEKLQFSAITRCGYPWDRGDRLETPRQGGTRHEGIDYSHLQSPTNRRLLCHYALAAADPIASHARAIKAARIHAASNHTNALPALLAARRLGIPFQYEMRGLWELSRASRSPGFSGSPHWRLGLDLEGFVARQADALFVISSQLGKFAKEHWGIPPEKIRLLPNCVDVEPQSGVQPENDLIGYAGSLVAYEGLDVLLDALARLKRTGKRYRLRVIGDGEARIALERQTRELGLENQVVFHGRLPLGQARQRLAECALVCIPRRPFAVCRIVPPIKLVEAMALARPIIAPDLPVFRDELGDCASGSLFEAGNSESLAELLRTKLSRPELLAEEGLRLAALAQTTRRWPYFIRNLLPEAASIA